MSEEEAKDGAGSTTTAFSDKTASEHPNADGNSHDWALAPTAKQRHERDISSGFGERQLGVTWKGLTVEAISSDAAINENALSQFNVPKLALESRHKPPLKTILEDSHGCVKPGEMLFVLGRPGSGCTTLLKMLSNKRNGFASISGDVRFGSLDHKEAAQYRGQIVMNTEDELFFPTLTVEQTINFASRLKVPSRLPNGISSAQEYRDEVKEYLLESMGISHTKSTNVGNEFVRGVSGGERKRVSIVECLATRGSVFCWDNSTRGLDASTALEWTRAIRAITDILGLSSIVTLYQAGNGIYDLFDKVLVLDQGKEIYYGPRQQARPFMEDLGFVCREGENIGDFLSGVTVPTERLIRPGCEDSFPRDADAILARYEQSPIRSQMVAEYDYPTTDIAKTKTAEFTAAIADDKHPRLPKKSPYTTGLITQIIACIVRQYQILWGDKATFFIKQIVTVFQAVIAGSLFYDAPENSAGLFIKSGAVFFSLLHNSLMAMSEVTDSFSGRPVLTKHKGFGLFHPAAFCIAQITADIPVLFVQITIFALPLYFMAGLTASASAFFTYWVVVFATSMVSTQPYPLFFSALSSLY